MDRRGKVLQKVYSEVNEGRVAKCRRDYFLADTLLEIKKTLEANHKELLAKLDEETNKICDKLEQLHLDNQQIVQELRNGFAVLHKDMVEIKTQLSNIKETLDKMDTHLEAINHSIVEGFKETNAKLEKINNTVKVGFEVQAQLQREQLAELRIQSSRLMDLTLVGANGYNNSGSLWDSPYAKDQSSMMSSRFTAIRKSGNSSSIAKFVGGLAAAGATFIPCVGPFIAPAVGKLTEHVVDNAVIPNAQQLFSDITNPNDRRSLKEKVSDTVKKAGVDTLNSVVQAAPVIWQEEKQNLLTAAQKLADKAGIPEELSNDVLDVVDSDSLDEAAGKLAEKCGVPKEALTFAAQYIY